MMTRLFLLFYINIFFTLCVSASPATEVRVTASPIRIVDMKTEYQVNPLGIAIQHPRLFWQLTTTGRNRYQTAYRILVSTDPALLDRDSCDTWDSGKVQSGHSIHIPVEGKPLTSRSRYYWKIRIWDQDHRPSAWSDVSWWEMGLLYPSDWRASWVQSGLALVDTQYFRQIIWPETAKILDGSQRAVRFAKTLTLAKPVKSARLYATARGLYELRVNGTSVDSSFMKPGWTDYRQRILYQVYDVTTSLAVGTNTLALELGHGWYAGAVAFYGMHQYGDDISFLLQLEVTFADQTTAVITSDTTWRVNYSPIVSNDVIHGERYDARLEQAGWDRPGYSYDDTGWNYARLAPGGRHKLVASNGPAVTKVGELKPVSVSMPVKGTFVVDMGQNFSGTARLQVNGREGQEVRMQFAEIRSADGRLNSGNLYGARQEATYVLKGGGIESYTPTFSIFGYRYIEVTGFPGELTVDDITGIVLSGNHVSSGMLTTSDPAVNQLIQNIQWSFLSNFSYVPTDCPQRIERQGWMGDAGLFAGTATYLADMSAYFTKWMQDISDAQFDDGAYSDVSPRQLPIAGAPVGGTGGGTNIWGDAGIIIPWTMYQAYADTRMLEVHYTSMKRWIDYCQKNSNQLIRPDKLYGDWLPPHLPDNTTAPNSLVNTAYFAYCTQLFAQMAGALGKTQDATHYHGLYTAIKDSFNRHFLTEDGYFRIGPPDTRPFANQTLYALGLIADLFPSQMTVQIVQRLVEDVEKHGSLTTGIVGTKYINSALSNFGHVAIAYRLLANRDYPSWLNQVDLGATTIGEHWDSFAHDRTSRNHVALGAVGEWMYGTMAGISTDMRAPGYKRIVLKPSPGGNFTHVNASYPSIHGLIRSEWEFVGDDLVLTMEIPVNTTAAIYLPVSNSNQVYESGRAIKDVSEIAYIGSQDGASVFEVGSGLYQFTIKNHKQ